MIITDYLLSEHNISWDYARQLGIDKAVIRLPETADFDVTDRSHWQSVYDKFQKYGFQPVIIEPMPNCLHDHIKVGDSKRDECIDKVIKMFPIMHELGISTICTNFMAHVGWYRSRNDIKERGGALVTGFNIKDYKPDDAFEITSQQLWDNLKYFLEAVMPYADKYGIKLAFHPDDPPVDRLGSVSRILTSFDNINKAVHLVDSPNLGVTMCQATYAAMGENLEKVIPAFAKENKIFFVHFRDITGNKYDFHETFHDNGDTNMGEIIRLYKKCGVNVPVRVDHVPSMAGEDNETPGYAAVGRLFAIGYLKGLLENC